MLSQSLHQMAAVNDELKSEVSNTKQLGLFKPTNVKDVITVVQFCNHSYPHRLRRHVSRCTLWTNKYVMIFGIVRHQKEKGGWSGPRAGRSAVRTVRACGSDGPRKRITDQGFEFCATVVS